MFARLPLKNKGLTNQDCTQMQNAKTVLEDNSQIEVQGLPVHVHTPSPLSASLSSPFHAFQPCSLGAQLTS